MKPNSTDLPIKIISLGKPVIYFVGLLNFLERKESSSEVLSQKPLKFANNSLLTWEYRLSRCASPLLFSSSPLSQSPAALNAALFLPSLHISNVLIRELSHPHSSYQTLHSGRIDHIRRFFLSALFQKPTDLIQIVMYLIPKLGA